LHSLPLTPKREQTGWTLIHLIAQNINFPQKLTQNVNLQIQHKKPTRIKPTEKTKTKNGQPLHTTAQESGKSQTYWSTLTLE